MIVDSQFSSDGLDIWLKYGYAICLDKLYVSWHRSTGKLLNR